MGVGIAVILVLVAVMITPLAYSYTEKQEIELERLLAEYILKEPREGGAPDVELIDFEKLAQDEIDLLYWEVEDLQLIINTKISNVQTQNEIIAKEQIRITTAQELIQKEWNAAPVNKSQLLLEYKKLNELNDELKTLLSQKEIILKKIEIKELLQEIKAHDAKLIGVELSNNCVIMAKVGSGSCPTYEDLISLDSSNREISGEFSIHDGYFHREKSNYQDSYRFYDTEDTIRIIVDPPFNESIRIKMITIEPNLGVYADAYSRVIVDGKRILSQDRIINDCYTAKISADNWKSLLPDTIFTFRNGCESVEIVDTVTFNMPYTSIDIWSSPNIQHQHWLEEMKTKCKVKC